MSMAFEKTTDTLKDKLKLNSRKTAIVHLFLHYFFYFPMSTKGNRRAKGDKGPAKSSQSFDLMSSLSSIGNIDMSLLNGISVDVGTTSFASQQSEQFAVYFGANESYRSYLKLLSKKSFVTKQKVFDDFQT